MLELTHIVEDPRRCSYIPVETASLEYRVVWDLDPETYGTLLRRGYRRFGAYLFRPACLGCTQCRSLRVLPQRFEMTKSMRRVLALNAGIEVQLRPLFVTDEHLRLYNRYHQFMREHRGWPMEWANARTYADNFVHGGEQVGRQWLYFDRGTLVGVALMDEVPGAVSLVYCFYDPAWRDRSPGTFSVLTQIEYARKDGLEFAYLGYWIAACQSMSYKVRFRPHEILQEYPRDGQEPVWESY